MKTDNTDLSVIVSIHPETGLGDLPHSSIARGTLVAPGLALVKRPSADLRQRLRMLAGPPLFEAPVAQVIPLGASFLALRADLSDWTFTAPVPALPGDPFDDEAADLAAQILAHCPAPDLAWFDRIAKARADQIAPPHPYPFPLPPAVESLARRQMTWASALRHLARAFHR